MVNFCNFLMKTNICDSPVASNALPTSPAFSTNLDKPNSKGMSCRPPGTRLHKYIFSVLSCGSLAIALAGCNSILTDRYEATAKVTYTWLVEYSTPRDKHPRQETFGTSSLVNRNGQKPEGAFTGPDDKGLWWPALPPRPTLEDLEQRQKSGEKYSKPEILKDVDYHLSYQVGEETVSLPTNHQVYREVAKAYPESLPLKFTLGVGNASVDKAER